MKKKEYRGIFLLLVAAIGVHFWVLFVASKFPSVLPFGDLTLYEYWVGRIIVGEPIYGISQQWVYPYLALSPMLLSQWISPINFQINWFILITLMNLFALCKLVDSGKGNPAAFRASWFWILFIALLGPIAIGRIDSFATAAAGLGLASWANNRNTKSIFWFTFGTWLKIWPIAGLIGLFVLKDLRIKVIFGAIFISIIIVCMGLMLSGDANLFSFITMQTHRGIQIEAPIATFWIWLAFAGEATSNIYYDPILMTNQVSGTGAAEAAVIMNLVLLIAITTTVWLGWRARHVDRNIIFTLVFLSITLELIVFNKVGSPQFFGWLALPVMAGHLFKLDNWRVVTFGVLAIAGLTELIYPILYLRVLDFCFESIVVLTIRNITLVIMWVFVKKQLAQLGKESDASLLNLT